MDYVYYFGYGANRDIEMIKAITGVDPIWGKEGLLKDYQLYLQPLKYVIDPKDFGQHDSFGAKTRLQGKWSKDFKSYVVKKVPGSLVTGTIWKITTNDFRWINNWELVDFGWYKIALDTAETKEGQKYVVYVQLLTDKDNPGEKVNGLNYPTYINDKKEILSVASGLRERIKKELNL